MLQLLVGEPKRSLLVREKSSKNEMNPSKKISLRGFYIFGILWTSRFHFCLITFNKGGGIFLICIFPKWPLWLSNT